MNVRRVKLRDIVDKSTGTRNPAKTPLESFIYVDVSAIDNAAKKIVGQRNITGAEAPSRARKLIHAGDILISTVRPNLNAVALVPKELDGQIASTGFCILRATTKVIPEYLYFFVRSCAFVDGLSSLVAGAMYPAVSDAQVLDQQIPLPPLDEQHRIVDILSRAEGIVRLRREAEKKAAEIIPALFIDMFGDPAINPKEWPVLALSALIVDGPQNGLYKHASHYGEGTPILRIDNFYDGQILPFSELKRVQVTPSELKKFTLQKHDIVINRVNSPEYLGKSMIVPSLSEETIFESNMMRFSVNVDALLPEYLIQLLQTGYTKSHFLSKAKHAINQSSINQQDVKSLLVILPSLPLQAQYVDRVEEIRSIQSQQFTATQKAESAFNALLAKFFTP
jgi:type I restriction enzyme S subunit